jgi:hypothetical protein
MQRELDPGERLLWAGCPQKGILFRKLDFALIPFSVFWAGFAIVWEVVVIRTNGPVVMIIWGIPFVLIGLMMLFGRFIVDARIRETTLYGVTDKRVIIIAGLFNRKIQSSDLSLLRGLTLIEAKNRKGTISFSAEYPYSSWMQNLPFGQTQAPQFEMIENARDVYDIISRARMA